LTQKLTALQEYPSTSLQPLPYLSLHLPPPALNAKILVLATSAVAALRIALPPAPPTAAPVAIPVTAPAAASRAPSWQVGRSFYTLNELRSHHYILANAALR
jgi:hypothetical protein